MLEEDGINWVDASGFSLAKSSRRPESINSISFRHDYDLIVDDEVNEPRIKKVF